MHFQLNNIFNLTIGLSGHNPILSQGKSLSVCACVCIEREKEREQTTRYTDTFGKLIEKSQTQLELIFKRMLINLMDMVI